MCSPPMLEKNTENESLESPINEGTPGALYGIGYFFDYNDVSKTPFQWLRNTATQMVRHHNNNHTQEILVHTSPHTRGRKDNNP